MDEVDLFEINEAFAAQSIAGIKELATEEKLTNGKNSIRSSYRCILN